MVQLQLKGSPYQIADSMYGSVLEELGRNDILEPEQWARTRYYYRNLIDPKSSAFFRHHCSQRLAHIIGRVEKLGLGAEILDVACGMGTQAILYGLLGCKVTGIDLNPEDIAIANQRLQFYDHEMRHPIEAEFVVGDGIEHVRDSRHQYDVVTVLEALSHIHPAEEFLDSVGRVMKPGGLLIISDTNALNPLVRWKLFCEVGTWGYVVREAKDEVTGEVRRYAYKRVFSAPSLGRMLRARGYKIVGAHGSGFVPAMVARRSTLFKVMKGVERLACTLPGHHLLGISYTLVAQKGP